MYSNCNNKGHFGISKIIIGETGIKNAINDYNSEYGMTQDAFGIIINTLEESNLIFKAIKTNKFIKLIRESCSWSNFRIDYRLFMDFKKDFYKDFLNDDINEINTNINKYEIIKDGRKKYYLIEDKLYKVKKNKSIGDHIGYYTNNQIIYN
jgi:hypothetical protein